MSFPKSYLEKINKDIDIILNSGKNPYLHHIKSNINKSLEGVSRLVMLDRYAYKDIEKITLTEGDFVILTIKDDPKFPARGLGWVTDIDWDNKKAKIKVEKEFHSQLEPEEYSGIVERSLDAFEKPLELFYEQIAMRNAEGLASVEETKELQDKWTNKFYNVLQSMKFVPAGRVLYGAGADTEVTYFNCYVMPFIKDSRGGISDHRKQVMEIMSRGGGVGTNGSTLRPRNALAKGVNGKSSGSVSWLNDIANLTNLVEQGGSRRGAQMIMLADWHPDIMEFIISKMQNPRILRFIIDNSNDEQIIKLAKEKLKFEPLKEDEIKDLESLSAFYQLTNNDEGFKRVKQQLDDGGKYSVHNPEFLTGANISVCLTHEFMNAVENNDYYELRFPDVENYSKEEMKEYNEKWHEIGDIREWHLPLKIYRRIKARDLWELINICATYSAEPGIFFIDNANDMTNAKAYGQKVVATNPCGEQPLAPYSVCNLAAVNLAEMVKDKQVNWEDLKETVRIGTRMQDNVIDATPYFLEENKKQALGERRVGLGVMGLHDLLIKCEIVYGSDESNKLVEEIFKTIAITAYETSIELAKEKGSFPFLEHALGDFRHEFINTGYMKQMPWHIKEGVLMHGIRNSHLLTVAPTGSTGTMVGVSTGLEPYFSYSYYRSGRLGKFIEVKADIAQEWLDANPDKDELPEWFISTMELSPEAHADTQCIIQKWVDSSLSKTVNAPKGYSVEQVEKVYERLWKGGAKGGTVYVDGSRDSQVLSLTNEESKFEDNFSEEKQQYIAEVKNEDSIKYGSEIGDTCYICREGIIEEIGGCNTCTNCNAQLQCGL